MKSHIQNKLSTDLSSAPSEETVIPALFMSEMPILLTLDELRPNPDNPRTGRNPRYDEIKSSIRQRGLDSVPKITHHPDGNSYIFSDGGNTRYQILTELWQETQDHRFYHIHCLFKPWPGRLHCVIGHLAENEIRGDLTFIEKAQGIKKARQLLEQQNAGKKLSLRELASLLKQHGLPIHFSSISKMEDTVEYLYPFMPQLLESGLGRDSIDKLLLLRSCLKKIGEQFYSAVSDQHKLINVFNIVCRQFDSPELYSREALRDELIGELVKQCPHPNLNYERWLFELEVNKGKHILCHNANKTMHPANINAEVFSMPLAKFSLEQKSTNKQLSQIETSEKFNDQTIELKTAARLKQSDSETRIPTDGKAQSIFPQNCADLWPLAPYQQDIEHLQGQIYRLTFELADSLGITETILPTTGKLHSSGFTVVDHTNNSPFCQVMQALTEPMALQQQIALPIKDLLLGNNDTDTTPILNDRQFLQWMKLIYWLRCLRTRQRQIDPNIVDEENDIS